MSEADDGRALRDLGVARLLHDGEVLVREGDESDSVFVVISGVLSATVRSTEGEIAVGEMHEGEVIGEVAAMAGLKRSATVSAVGAAHVAVIDRTAFAGWLTTHPERADTIATEARHRLNRTQVAEMTLQVLGDAAGELVPEMLAAAQWVDIAAGDVLFREGDAPDAAYFVLSGRLQISVADVDGSERVLRDVGRWEVVGELAIIQHGPRSATVTALRDTTLARFPLDAFERLLVSHPSLMLLVVRRMVSRLTGGGAAATGARHAARSMTLITAGVDAGISRGEDVVGPMVAAVSRLGNCKVLSSDLLDSALGRDRIAQSTVTDVGASRVSQYLDEVEAAHDFVLYLADAAPSPWSRRAVQRADTIVVLAPAVATPEALRAVDAALDTCRQSRAPRWLALVDDATATRPTSARTWPQRAAFEEVHHVRRGNASDLERLGRLALGAGYGLVLGGGGARGFAHLGVLRALGEAGVPVDRLGGASMGSIFAAGAALFEDIDQITAVSAQQFKRLLDYTIPVVSLIKAKRITSNLEHVFGGLEVDDLWVPLYCVSTNLTRSALHVHRAGDLLTALRASIAIPGVLPPVPFEGDLLVDGGVLNNVPADVMRADRSIGTVLASDVAPPSGPGVRKNYGMFLSGWQALRQPKARRTDAQYPGVGSVLIRTMITSSEGRRAAMRRDGTADLYLELEMAGVGLLEFDRMTPILRRGHDAAKPLIDEWVATRPELRAGSGST